MKGKRKSALFILLIVGIIYISNISDISVETINLTYEIPKARLNTKMNGNTRKITQFDFNGKPYQEKTQVTVDTEYHTTAVSSTYKINTEEKVWGYSTNSLKLLMEQYIRYTYKLGIRLNRYWEDLTFENGTDFYLYPYIIPETDTWVYFEDLGESLNTRYEEIAQDGQEVDFQFSINEENDYFLFESWLGGEFNGKYGVITDEESTYSEPANVTFDNLFKIAINKQTGVISGFRMKGRVKGIINEDKMNVLFEYQYQENGYRLTNFKLGPNFIVDPYIGRKLAIIIPTIGTVCIGISISIIFIRKRKIKKV